MINIADIVVLMVIALSALIGYKRGFIKTGFGFVSFFLAIALTFIFYKPVMNLIQEQTGFEAWLTEYLAQTNFHQNEEEEEISAAQEEESLREAEESYLDQLPNSIVELIGLKEMKENAKNIVIQKIVNFSVKLLAIIVVYIAARLLLLVITLVLDLVAKLPVLKQCNEVLGLVVGTILGLVRIYGVLAIITFMSSLSLMSGLIMLIQNSLIASLLYNHNVLLGILF